jgi:hypothetical protein
MDESSKSHLSPDLASGFVSSGDLEEVHSLVRSYLLQVFEEERESQFETSGLVSRVFELAEALTALVLESV